MLWATPQPAAAPRPARRGDLYPHITNVQFSTESLISDVCKLVERIRYEAYGRARHSWPEDLDEDGTFWFIDRNIALDHIAGSAIGDNGSWPAKRYNVLMDFDFSGTIEQVEYDAIQNNPDRAALPAGRISDSDFASGPWNPIGYDGYVYDDAADMSAVRFRWYDAKLGRWVSRDPAGYVDGTSLYQYGQSNSLKYSDPSGLRIGVVPNMKQQDRDAIAIMLDDLCPGAKWNHYGSSTIGSQEGGNGRMRGTSEEQPLQESTGLPNA